MHTIRSRPAETGACSTLSGEGENSREEAFTGLEVLIGVVILSDGDELLIEEVRCDRQGGRRASRGKLLLGDL
jgi:hypothetical protein